MVIIRSISKLYNVDARYGDNLLEPQRYVNRVWKAIVSPLKEHKSKILQIAARVVVCAMLILPTVCAYLLGVPAILLKATVSLPPSRARQNIEEPVIPGVSSERGAVPETLLQPVRGKPRSGFPIPHDVTRYIFRLLPAEDLVRVMHVSKECRRLAASDILWEPALLNLGITGPLKTWTFERVRNGALSDLRAVARDNLPDVAGAYEQTQAYHVLKQQGDIRFPDFFDYLARLNKGGPVGFRNIQELKLETIPSLERPRALFDPIRGVLPEHMPSSLMKGVDSLGRSFLALKLIDRAAPNPKEFVLVFVYGRSPEQKGGDFIWYHAQAGNFNENQLKLTDQKTLNYILNLIKGEGFGDQILSGFSSALEFV